MPDYRIMITPSTPHGSPAGRLAEAEIQFLDGPLEGLRLIGFGIWERRSPSGRRNVTFPARAYSVNGERRSYALLRPTADTIGRAGMEPSDRLRDAILDAYAAHERGSVEA